ncbi:MULTISPECIES: MMPL family transporter [Streptomyces]|uniref:MMPL family transporter n=1 Tax=Streptomyces TaxID=1883 RepID=UPI001E2D1D6D|nr:MULTISPECIES: MMPL family transporter [Streptomyces]UFQ20387.1 MMPL family transporter [Streptomyces huasconensis]WCL89998.1 MMPL family transporter [Streptomyces sp. JCM 35825]
MARWSALHPWRAIVGWLVFVVLCLGGGIAVGLNSATSEDFRVGEAGRAEALAAEGGVQLRPTEQVLIRAASGPLDEAAADAAVKDVTARMKALPEVASVAEPVRSADGRVLRVQVELNGSEQEDQEHVPPLQAQTEKVAQAHPGLVIEETGDASVSKGVSDQRGEDLAFSEAITLPITLITLAVVFGSVVMVGVPVLLAITSIMATMGLAMVASHLLPDTGVGMSMILLIGMAVGVDYTLFYLKREREERARAGGRLTSEALVEAAAATAGRAIVVSGLAVIVSTTALFLARDVIFDSLATGTILVVAVAVVSSVTVLPALLVKLGHRTERRAAKRVARGKSVRAYGENRPGRAYGEKGPSRVWHALLTPARKHPALTLGVSVLVMLGLALPALEMNLKNPARDSFSREIPAMKGYDRLLAAFPELRVRHLVVVRAKASQSDEVRQALRELDREAKADPLFTARSTGEQGSGSSGSQVLRSSEGHGSGSSGAQVLRSSEGQGSGSSGAQVLRSSEEQGSSISGTQVLRSSEEQRARGSGTSAAHSSEEQRGSISGTQVLRSSEEQRTRASSTPVTHHSSEEQRTSGPRTPVTHSSEKQTPTAPLLRSSEDRRTTTLELNSRHATYSTQAEASLDRLRHRHIPATLGKLSALPGVETAVTGEVARGVDYVEHQNGKLPLVLGFLLLMTFAMTVHAFRSVVLGLLGVGLNLISAASALGLLVLVFQGRWAEDLLSFVSLDGISSRVPLFLFVILFGLSMDYQVFVVSRIREAALNGVPTRQAVLDGIASSAKVVTSAALVMVTVFASFVMLHILEMKQMGFVLAAAVLLDAFVIRVMILPAALLLLGRATWWPSGAVRRAQERPAPRREGPDGGVSIGPGRAYPGGSFERHSKPGSVPHSG